MKNFRHFIEGFVVAFGNNFIDVGMRGFEPPISRPPDEHFNRTKLHPDNRRANISFYFVQAVSKLKKMIDDFSFISGFKKSLTLKKISLKINPSNLFLNQTLPYLSNFSR